MMSEAFFDWSPQMLNMEGAEQKIREKMGLIQIDDVKDFFEDVKESWRWPEIKDIFNLLLIVFCVSGITSYLLDIKILPSAFTLLIVSIGAFKLKK